MIVTVWACAKSLGHVDVGDLPEAATQGGDRGV